MSPSRPSIGRQGKQPGRPSVETGQRITRLQISRELSRQHKCVFTFHLTMLTLIQKGKELFCMQPASAKRSCISESASGKAATQGSAAHALRVAQKRTYVRAEGGRRETDTSHKHRGQRREVIASRSAKKPVRNYRHSLQLSCKRRLETAMLHDWGLRYWGQWGKQQNFGAFA